MHYIVFTWMIHLSLSQLKVVFYTLPSCQVVGILLAEKLFLYATLLKILLTLMSWMLESKLPSDTILVVQQNGKEIGHRLVWEQLQCFATILSKQEKCNDSCKQERK